MPVELSNLLSNERWIDYPVGDQVIRVAYRPGATSYRRQAELQREMRQLQANTDGDEMELVCKTAEVFCEMVSNWDITNGGRTLPITVDTVIDLPGAIVNGIMAAITADGQSQQAEKKALSATSAVISPAAVNPAHAQNGIQSSEKRGTWA